MSRIRPFPGPLFAPRKMDSPPPPRTDKSITRISGSGLRGKISLFAEFLGWIALLPSFSLPGNKHVGPTDRQENWRSV